MRALHWVCLLVLIGLSSCQSGRVAEVRGLWVVRYSLTSPESIDRMVAGAARNGFNTLFVQVRGRGDAYYRSSLEPRSHQLNGQPRDFDPLQRVLDQARPLGIQVHAWVNTLLVSSLTRLPDSPDHIVNRHPEWLQLPDDLAATSKLGNPSSPRFLPALLEYSKKNSAQLEGLYLDPSRAEVREHLVALSLDLLSKYEVDGIHYDYTRYPNPDFGYTKSALESFARVRGWRAASWKQNVERARQASESWDQFRRHQVTAIMQQLFVSVKRAHPDRLVTAAVHPDAEAARTRRLQDWPEWLRRRIIDGICPMVYVEDTGLFQQQLQRVVRLRTGRRVWAGIGAYKISTESAAEKVSVSRRLRTDGFIMFSYTSLVDPKFTTDGKATLDGVGEFLVTN